MSRYQDENPLPDDAHDDRPSLAPAFERTRDALDRIHGALRGLRYGTVTAVVHDGVVVQVERTEKIRLDARSRRESAA
jgi:hypothetical protein